jgi:hypothetical protein
MFNDLLTLIAAPPSLDRGGELAEGRLWSIEL